MYQVIVIKKALEVYARTGMRVNGSYTPSNMMKTAEKLTGRKFKKGDYVGAAKALGEKLEKRT